MGIEFHIHIYNATRGSGCGSGNHAKRGITGVILFGTTIKLKIIYSKDRNMDSQEDEHQFVELVEVVVDV